MRLTNAETTEPVPALRSKFGLVADIARRLRENSPDRNGIGAVLKHLARVVPLDAVTLYVHDRDRDRPERLAGHGPAIDLLEFVRFDRGDGLIGWAAEHGEPIVIQGRDPEHDHVRLPHDSIMILPLTIAGDPVGILCCGSHTRMAFDDDRREVMEIVADQMAVAVERFLFHRDLDSSRRSLAEAREELEEARSRMMTAETFETVRDLAVSVHQEINDTLAAIIGNAQMIELETSDLPQKLNRNIRAIVDGARKISLITHKLSKIDRLITENYPPDRDSTMLNIHESTGEHS